MRSNDALLKRRAAARERAFSALNGKTASISRARESLDEIGLIDEMLALEAKGKRTAVPKAMAFAGIAAMLVALGSVIRIGDRQISVRAKASEVAISLGPRSSIDRADLDLRTIRVSNVTLDANGPPLTEMTALTAVAAQTQKLSLVLRQSGDGCFDLKVSDGRARISLAGGPPTEPSSLDVDLHPGSLLTFCVRKSGRLLVQDPAGLRLAAVWQDDTPPVYVPSLTNGSLTFLNTGIIRRLGSTDRLEITGSGGSLIADLDKAIEVRFDGRAGDIRRLAGAGPQSGGDDPRPTAVAAALASPEVTAIATALAGVLGFLWSLSRLFSKG